MMWDEDEDDRAGTWLSIREAHALIRERQQAEIVAHIRDQRRRSKKGPPPQGEPFRRRGVAK